jgi:hypothetical protein
MHWAQEYFVTPDKLPDVVGLIASTLEDTTVTSY